MAQYPITPTGTTNLLPVYTDLDGDRCGVELNIDSVKYNNATNKLDITYTFKLRTYTGYWDNVSGLQASIGGTKIYENFATWVYTWDQYTNGTVVKTGTISIVASKGTTQSIALSCKAMYYYGYSDYNWNNNVGCCSSSGTMKVAVPGDPSVTLTVEGTAASTRGSANGSITGSATSPSAGTNGGSYEYYITVDGSQGSKNASKTKTGLYNNVSYTVSITITNSFGLSVTKSSTKTLTPLAPSIGAANPTPSRTGCTFAPTVTYDYLRKYSSISIKYGKTTSYGSTATSTSLSGLAANTTYYYSMTVIDANNGGSYTSAGTSSAKTGSFTTTGNAPVVDSVSAAATRTGSTITASVTYDTNALNNGYSVQYGTSTSYGSTSTSLILSGLAANTTYYYRVKATDNFGRTSSSWKTGSFTTTGNAPSITSVSANSTRTGCTLTPTVTYDTNAAYKSYSLKYGKTTSYGTTVSTNVISSGLTANTKYYYSLTVTDNFSRTSAAYTGNFTTAGNAPTINSLTVTPDKFSAVFAPSISYDNTSLGSYLIEYGTTTSYGLSSSSLTLSDLEPETQYYYRFKVTDAAGRSSTKTGSFTTLSDQAKAWIKVDGVVKHTKTWIKVDGTVKPVQKIYQKVNGVWKKGVN